MATPRLTSTRPKKYSRCEGPLGLEREDQGVVSKPKDQARHFHPRY